MKKTFSILAIAVCGLWGTSRAMATPSYCTTNFVGNLVVNCGFETGSFSGWTISGTTSNPGGVDYGVDAFDAQSGSFGAYMSQDLFTSTAPVVLSQTLATTAGVTYGIVFFLEQDTTPATGYAHTFVATFGSTTIASLAPTVAFPGTVGSFVQYTATVAATGPTTVLNFAFENDDSLWSFDDVAVISLAAVPEPSTFLLAGAALGGLLLARRRVVG
jgi:hypothetical protein